VAAARLPQAPLCRFGDTAANAGMLTLLAELPATQGLPLGVKTLAASSAAACWRMALTPVDVCKTMMQVGVGVCVWGGGVCVLY
jgi:hypothetical protein